jgi:hypothetical protein
VNETEQQELIKVESPETIEEIEALQSTVHEQKPADEIDLSEELNEPQEAPVGVTPSPGNGQSSTIQVEELEKVMNNGMQFLSGLFKMATGKEMGMESQKIEVNRETGEVTMKFKLPV